jgi:lysophospholipase L1-like esterase
MNDQIDSKKEASRNAVAFYHLINRLESKWPDNRAINIVYHGHSVPAGYFDTPNVRTFEAYPHLFHLKLKSRFPQAVINTIVTAIGGESSTSGVQRSDEVLAHRPDLVMIDYGMNDLGIPPEEMKAAWIRMIETFRNAGIYVVLITPTWDAGEPERLRENSVGLKAIAAVIEEIGRISNVPVADVYGRWTQQVASGIKSSSMLSWSNHPNAVGHELICQAVIDSLSPWEAFTS